MQNENPDTRSAVDFVIERIKEQANRTGEPLDNDERFSLTNLPKSWFSGRSAWSTGPYMPRVVLENPVLEKFYRLTKDAHSYDLAADPEATLDWNFAGAVLRLDRHALSLLLRAVGIKEQKPWWDGLLLVGAGLLLVCAMLGFLTLLSWLSIDSTMISFGGFALTIGVLYFPLQRLENWQLKQTIEKCRSLTRMSVSHDTQR